MNKQTHWLFQVALGALTNKSRVRGQSITARVGKRYFKEDGHGPIIGQGMSAENKIYLASLKHDLSGIKQLIAGKAKEKLQG